MVKVSEIKDLGQRNRYYKLRRVILSGVPEGGVTDYIKVVEILESGTRKSLIEKNREVRRSLAKSGLVYEDCYCAPMERIGDCYQLVGMIRLKKVWKDEDLIGMLKAKWSNVKVMIMAEMDLRAYIRVTMLKSVVEGKYGGQHLVKSKGWTMAEGNV